MKRLLSVVISIFLLSALFTGAAFAKPDNAGKSKGSSAGKTETVTQITKRNQEAEKITERANVRENYSKLKKVQNRFRQMLSVCNSGTDKCLETANRFKDVEQSWARSSIAKMAAIGLFNGYKDGTFKPNAPVTQAETVVLIMKIAPEDELSSTTETDQEAEVNEEDINEVPGWAKDAAMKAARKGIINLNRFHSQVQATRAQVAAMIAKALGLQPVDTANIPFKDGILISPEDAGYIMALYQEGIIKGTPDGKFNPNSAITRAEMAAVLERLLEEPAQSPAQSEETASSGESSGEPAPAGEDAVSGTENTSTENASGEAVSDN